MEGNELNVRQGRFDFVQGTVLATTEVPYPRTGICSCPLTQGRMGATAVESRDLEQPSFPTPLDRNLSKLRLPIITFANCSGLEPKQQRLVRETPGSGSQRQLIAT